MPPSCSKLIKNLIRLPPLTLLVLGVDHMTVVPENFEAKSTSDEEDEEDEPAESTSHPTVVPTNFEQDEETDA